MKTTFPDLSLFPAVKSFEGVFKPVEFFVFSDSLDFEKAFQNCPRIEKVPEMNPDFLSFEEVVRIVTEEMNKAIRGVELFNSWNLSDKKELAYLQGKADALVMIASKLIAKPFVPPDTVDDDGKQINS